MLAETEVEAESEPAEQRTAATGDDNDAGRNQDNGRCPATSMMLRISGVRRSRSTSTSKAESELPTYGVDHVPDCVLVEVQIVWHFWEEGREG